MSHEDLLKAAGAAGGFVGAAWAAAKFWKRPARPPEKGGGEMSDVLQRIARLEEQAVESKRRDDEASVRDDAIFSRLNSLDKKTSAVLAILDERRGKR